MGSEHLGLAIRALSWVYVFGKGPRGVCFGTLVGWSVKEEGR